MQVVELLVRTMAQLLNVLMIYLFFMTICVGRQRAFCCKVAFCCAWPAASSIALA